MSKKLKNIGIVSLLTIVSRVLGLVRDQLGAAILGTSVLNSAFLTAFNTPNLFRRLLAEGSLTAAFVPTLQEALRDRGQAGAFELLSKVTSRLLVVSGLVVALAMALFSQSRLLGGHEDKWYLAADLTVLLFPYLALICLAAAFNAALNVLQRFTEPALSPIWLNLAMIVSLGGAGLHWAETDLGKVHWLCAGVLVGGALQMLVPAWVLVRAGWRPRFDLAPSPGVQEIARLMAPGVFGTAIYQINIYISRLLAFSIDDSAATVLFYANRLMELPIGVFAIAVSTVVYPLIARHAAEGKFAEMGGDYLKGVRLIVLINIPAAVGLALLAEPIVRLLFQRGQFTAADTAMMAPIVAWFAIGMPFFSVVSLTTRAFYAVKDTRTPVVAATISFVINLGLSFALKGALGVTGLVLASTAAIVVQTFFLQRALQRRLPAMTFRPLVPTLAKIAVAVAALALVVEGGWRAMALLPREGRAPDWLVLSALIPLGVVVYAAALWLLKIEGREELLALARRKGGRRKTEA